MDVGLSAVARRRGRVHRGLRCALYRCGRAFAFRARRVSAREAAGPAAAAPRAHVRAKKRGWPKNIAPRHAFGGVFSVISRSRSVTDTCFSHMRTLVTSCPHTKNAECGT